MHQGPVQAETPDIAPRTCLCSTNERKERQHMTTLSQGLCAPDLMFCKGTTLQNLCDDFANKSPVASDKIHSQ